MALAVDVSFGLIAWPRNAPYEVHFCLLTHLHGTQITGAEPALPLSATLRRPLRAGNSAYLGRLSQRRWVLARSPRTNRTSG